MTGRLQPLKRDIFAVQYNMESFLSLRSNSKLTGSLDDIIEVSDGLANSDSPSVPCQICRDELRRNVCGIWFSARAVHTAAFQAPKHSLA